MVTKLKKINPVSYRLGFCFFWNKSINNTIKKFNKFLKFIYIFSYFFTIIFEKFFKFQIYKLNYFFKFNQLLFNFNIYSFNLIYFSLFNLYLPKLYINRLNISNFKVLKKKIILKKFLYLSKYNNSLVNTKLLSLAIQFSNNIYLKISNNKLFTFFFAEFLYLILKKKICCSFIDNNEILPNKSNLLNFLSKNLQLYSKLKLKIKNSFFNFLILSAWLSLIQKDSYFFTKFITFGLKTRTQKIFLRFLRKLLVEFFTVELPQLKLITSNFLKGIQIGIFGKIFGKRRSTKLYLKYYKKKTLLSTLFFKKIHFTFLKSWTYYGIFGIKVWFFF